MNVTSQPSALEEKFYSEKFYFSYSGLNRLMHSPRLFYKHYIQQDREDKLDSHLIEGKVIHCLLLDNGSFDKQFIVSPDKFPGESNKKVIDRLFNMFGRIPDPSNLGLAGFKGMIVDLLKEINLHQKLKTDDQRTEKIITPENINYWNYLKEKGNRDILDQETLSKCNEAVGALRSNTQVSDLLRLKASNSPDIINEYYLKVEIPDYPFGLKGILDNLIIDRKNKKIYINDLKTSGKTLADFKETVEYYMYWLQAAIYESMVRVHYAELIKEGYSIEFSFIVIDKYQQVYPFNVSKETMLSWTVQLIHTLEKARYHYAERQYDLPYEFATGKVTL